MIAFLFGIVRSNVRVSHPCCWVDGLGVVQAYKAYLERETRWAWLKNGHQGSAD